MRRRSRSRSRSDAQPYRPISKDFISKLHLVWTKRFGCWQRLSFNITREICSYLSYASTYVRARKGTVSILDLNALLWRPLPPPEQCDSQPMFHCATNISDSQVFMCGGCNWVGKAYAAKRQTLFADYKVRVELHPMVQARTLHEIIYDEGTLAVYAFGGYVNQYSLLSSSEVFDFRKGRWTELPPMQRLKGIVTLCLHRSSIYLTDYSMNSERFHIPSRTYTAIDFDQPASSYSLSLAVYQHKLCGLHESCYDQWDLETGVLLSHCSGEEEEYRTYQNGIVVRGSCAYLEYHE